MLYNLINAKPDKAAAELASSPSATAKTENSYATCYAYQLAAVDSHETDSAATATANLL